MIPKLRTAARALTALTLDDKRRLSPAWREAHALAQRAVQEYGVEAFRAEVRRVRETR